MNAQMRIYVRVINAASPQLAQIQSQLRGLQTAQMGAAAAGGALTRASDGMLKWGKNMQWTGRQIEYNFTLPLVLAGAMAQKWANENETAFVRIQKVYGDASMSSQQMQSETNALRGAFVSLSNMTGIAQKDILDIAGDWAAAGSSGVALGKATRLTAEAMVLGEMSATDASKALISIQAQYGFATGEINRNRAALEQQAGAAKGTGFQVKTLADTVAVLNMVENQTGVSFEGLVQGFQKAAGTARTAGVDVQHLAAFIAAITPAAGTAAQAGNSLKTIFARLLVPTKQASQLLGQIGINTRDVTWQNKSATQRLEELASAYTKLNPQQQMFLDKAIAGVYQISRFSVMMRSITDANGYYQKALKSTNSEAAVQLQYVKELGMVLDSQPNKFKILTTTIQNSLASAIIPLTPAILGVLNMVTHLAMAFANLDPRWQKAIMYSLAFLAILGPVLRYLGAFAALFGLVGKAFIFFTAGISRSIAILEAFFGLLRLDGVWTVLVSGAQMAARAIIFAFTALAPALMPFFGWLGTSLSGILSGSFFRTFVGGAITRAWGALMFALGPITSAAGASITAIWNSIWAILSSTTSVGGPLLQRAWAFVMTAIELITAGVASSSITIWESFQAAMVSITAFGRTALLAVYQGLSFVLQGLWLNLTVGLSSLWTRMWAFMSASGGASGVISSIGAFFTRMYGVFMQGWAGLRAVNTSGVFTATVGIWAAAIVAVLALIVHFRSQIGQVFGNIRDVILRAFYALPRGVQNAFIAVINVVRSAIDAVRHWLGYLNPFQRHSPSLVDNVNAGTGVIAKKYLRLGQSVVNSLAGAKAAMEAQQNVVDNWKDALDRAQDAVDAAQKALDRLQKTAQAAQDRLQASKDALDQWANTPIVGMRAMSDAIFNNEIASKRLQLQIMRLEDAGKAPEQLADKFSKLQGDIEQLRGDSQSLRAMGAGSDVLKPINDQIKAVTKQADAVQNQQKQYGGLTEQLDRLNRKGQELDLENSLNFDPLTRSIDQMTHSMKEVPYAEIIRNIRIQQSEVAKNQVAYDAATAAVNRQQAVVDALKDRHDAINAVYDAEQKKLDKLKDAYDKLNEAAQNAAAGLEKVKAAKIPDVVKDFNAAGNATAFPDPGSDATIGREGGPGDQTAQIDQMAKDWADESKSAFGKIDMFGPFKDMFRSAVKWVDDHTGGWLTNSINKMKQNPGVTAASAAVGGAIGFAILGPIGGVLGAGAGALLAPFIAKMDIPGKFKALVGFLNASGVTAAFQGAGHAIGGFFQDIADVAGKLWGLFGPDVMKLLDAIGNGMVYAFKQVGAALAPFGALIGPIGEAFSHLWHVVEPLIALALTPLLFVFKTIASVLSSVAGPAIKFWVDFITWNLHIMADVIGFIVSLINGDWGKAFHYLGKLFSDTFGGFGKLVGDAFGIVWGAVKGFVEGIVHFFQWLFDVLIGHSIIPDLINGIINWFLSLPGKIIGAIWGIDKAVWGLVLKINLAILKGFAQAGLWLLETGAKISWGLMKGIFKINVWIAKFIWGLPLFFLKLFIGAEKWLIKAGWWIIDGIFTGLYTIGKRVWDFFATVPKMLYDAMTNAPHWLYQKGQDVINGLFNGFANAVSGTPGKITDLFNKISDWFAGLPKWISDTLVPKIGDFFAWIFQIPAYLLSLDWGHIASTIVDGIGNGIKWAMNNPGEIAKIAGYIALGMIAVVAGIPLLLGAAVLTMAGAIVLGIINGILSIFGTSLGSLASDLGHLLSGLGGLIVDAGKWLWNTGSDMIHGMRDGMQDGGQAVADWFGKLPGWIWGYVSGAYNWIKRNGHDLLMGFHDGVADASNAVWDFFGHLAGRVWGYVRDAYNWIKRNGHDLLMGFHDGVADASNAVWNFFADLPGHIGGMVRGAGSWLYNTGKDLVIGLWNGLASMGRWLMDGLTNWIKSVIPGPIQRVLGIASPSKLTMWHGRMVAEGLAIGIEQNSDVVIQASTVLAQAAASGIDATAITQNAGLSFTESFRMGMLDGSGGVLDTAKSIAQGVNDTFANVQAPMVDFKVNKQNTQLPWQASAIQNGSYTLPRPSGIVSQSTEGSTSSGGLAPPVTNNNSEGDMHFHGDLSFPNVSSGDDAKEFISNLKALSK